MAAALDRWVASLATSSSCLRGYSSAADCPGGDHRHVSQVEMDALLALTAFATAEGRAAAIAGAPDRLAWCVVSAAIEWQDAPRMNDGHLRDRAIEERLLDALNDYRYRSTPAPDGAAREGQR